MGIVKKEAPTIISSAEQAIALYTLTPATISAQLKKYDDLKVIEGNTKSYKAVRAAHTALVTTRTTGDKRRKKLGEDARKQVSFINKAWAMLLAPMTPYEDRFKAELKAEDDRKQAIKDEKDRIEQERIDKIDEKIRSFDYSIGLTISMTSDEIADLCDEIVAIQITEEDFQEFTAKAKEVKLSTLSELDDTYNEKIQTEKEDAKRKAEIERLEKIRKENEAAQTKIDAEREKITTEKAQIEEGKRIEAEAKDRAEFERKAKEQAEAQAKRVAEQEKQRIEKEKVEAETEAKRVEALKPDKEKIIAFADIVNTLELPIVKSNEAKSVVIDIGGRLIELQSDIREQAEAL